MGRGSPFSSSFLPRLLWSGSREQFNVEETGLDVDPQVQVPAAPQACVRTRLGMGLPPPSQAKIKAMRGLIPRAQGAPWVCRSWQDKRGSRWWFPFKASSLCTLCPFLPAVGRTAFPVRRSWQDACPPLPLAAHRLGVCHGNPRARSWAPGCWRSD